MHSVVRIWPPTSVHARPVVAPISFFLSVVMSRKRTGPAGRADTWRALMTEVAIAPSGSLLTTLAGNLARRRCRSRVPDCAPRIHAYRTGSGSETFVGELDLLWPSDRLLHLLLDQKTLGDFEFLEFRIAGKPDDFHAVLQGRRNGVEHVRGRDEEDLADRSYSTSR